MITFTTLGSHGRLGNQLFQYAILLVVGERNGYQVKIPAIDTKTWHNQKCQLGNFKISATELSDKDVIEHTYEEGNRDNFSYNKDVFDVKDNTDIRGFFQNFAYYSDHIELIKRELTLRDAITDRSADIMRRLHEEHKGYEIVSLHLRRGDSDLGMYGGKSLEVGSRWHTYFSKAKEEFKDRKVKFLVFTGGSISQDDPLSDYRWCQDNLRGDEFIFANDQSPSVITDFSLMLQCDHHIISPISTLSWWVGFFGEGKKVIAPEKYYFLNRAMDDTFYPPHFILK